mgnify:CR=1 FL=1
MTQVAWLFPGQGSQIVGMGKEFYDKFDIVKKLFKEYKCLQFIGWGLVYQLSQDSKN